MLELDYHYHNFVFQWSFKFFSQYSVRPKEVSIISKREPLSADKSYWLECRTFGSRPPAIITWWKGDKFVGKTDQQVVACSIFQ